MNTRKEELEIGWFGFPVVFLDAPVKQMLGEDVLDANPGDVEMMVCRELVCRAKRLTGQQVFFLRHHIQMPMAELAKVLHQSNHSIVSQWEAHGKQPARMNMGTEMFFRLIVARQVFKPGEFHKVLDLLSAMEFTSGQTQIRIRMGGPSPLGRARTTRKRVVIPPAARRSKPTATTIP